jgi:hypothetical protein
MTLITNTWRQLIRRKLWPLALLLVGALVAVPLKLSTTPEPVAPPPASLMAKAETAEAIAKPIVELSSASADDGSRRRVLGATKDPFEPAPLPKAKKSKAKPAQESPTATATPTGGGGSESAPPSSAPPVGPPTTTVPKYSIKVRFGKTDQTAELPELTLARLDPLPSPDAPVLVYEGVKGKYAVFSIPADVTAVGDGMCSPNADDCSTLKLRAGET